jgi:amino acid adenylation domain-containing protein
MAHLLHQLLSHSAERAPDAVAVRHHDQALSYGTLERSSNRLAHALIARGVRPGDRVGLHLPKSADAIISLFGVLKAGACYVPVDVGNPPGRLLAIARQCEMRGLITSSTKLDELEPADLRDSTLQWVLLADTPTKPAEAPLPCSTLAHAQRDQPPTAPDAGGIDQDLAYVLFTSGSTGVPKGVMLSHLNALTFVNWAVERFGIQATDRLSNHAPLSFDLSVLDIFGAIAAGATVCLVPDGLARFPVRLAEWIEREEITVWYSVPSILRMLLTHGGIEGRDLSRLRLVLFAGEVFPVRHLRALMQALPQASYFNLYGPTETNVCTYYEVPAIPNDDVNSVPIGRPCANSDAFAMDEGGALVTTPGQEGVLYVRGSTVMQGYYGRPLETEAAFVPNPLAPGRQERLYCTQDWVSVDEAGNFVFLGRRDHMVKVGGYRIELGEIEAALCDHDRIREAAAVAVPDDLLGSRIRAIVVPVDGARLDEHEVRRHCGRRVPKYMVPAEVEFREQLPRTQNDKIDRPRLLQDLQPAR